VVSCRRACKPAAQPLYVVFRRYSARLKLSVRTQLVSLAVLVLGGPWKVTGKNRKPHLCWPWVARNHAAISAQVLPVLGAVHSMLICIVDFGVQYRPTLDLCQTASDLDVTSGCREVQTCGTDVESGVQSGTLFRFVGDSELPKATESRLPSNTGRHFLVLGP
jgi:hypothetical protein